MGDSGGWVGGKEGKGNEVGSSMLNFVKARSVRGGGAVGTFLSDSSASSGNSPPSTGRDPALGTAARNVTGTRNLLPSYLFSITLHAVDDFCQSV